MSGIREALQPALAERVYIDVSIGERPMRASGEDGVRLLEASGMDLMLVVLDALVAAP